MNLFLASAAAATLVAAADVDLDSPVIFISEDARAAVTAGTVNRLICLELPERSRRFRSACLTSTEWRKAVEHAEIAERQRKGGLISQPLPSQLHPSYQSWSYQSGGRR